MARKKETVKDDEVVLVPSSIFCERTLSFSEALVEYLWIEYRMGPSDIGRRLSMDRRNVWTIMERGSRKRAASRRDATIPGHIFIPVDIFSDRNFSVLETTTAYLKEEVQMDIKSIATLLNRSPTTIWTAYNRMRKKRGDLK
jgi:DNA-binding CsgD family transcriptional regulator